MSEVQLLFVVLAALYVWECACWVRRGSVTFTTWLGRGWQLHDPGTLVGNQRGGFVLAAPLPPLGTFLVANQLPLTLSPDGVLFFVSTNVNRGWRAAHTGRYLEFQELRVVRSEGRRLVLDGETVLNLSSPQLAQNLAELLRQLQARPRDERADAINEMIRARLDAEAVATRWGEVGPLLRPIRWLANSVFLLVFVVAPCLIWQLGFAMAWLGLLIALIALTGSTALFFCRAHRRLFPQLSDDRFTFTLTVALAPTTAMRAHDLLARYSCEIFHPLAVAKVFLGRSSFENFARRVLRDVRHPAQPVNPGGGTEMEAAELHGRTVLRAAVEDFLRSAGCDLKQLVDAPLPVDGSCRAYCPRCEAQFTAVDARCLDCGGLPVQAFSERASCQPA